jgi:hypothetical protein
MGSKHRTFVPVHIEQDGDAYEAFKGSYFLGWDGDLQTLINRMVDAGHVVLHNDCYIMHDCIIPA